MRLYAGTSKGFIQDVVHNQIATKLTDAFFKHYRFKPSPSEVTSWRNSLRAVSQIFDRAKLHDHGVMLEYQLPLTSKRLDCLVCGKDNTAAEQAVIIELKQWDQCTGALGEHLVTTWVGGANREVLHPSSQVGQYQQYLSDTHTAFYDGPRPIRLNACAYLHNYHARPQDILFRPQFQALLERYPAFTGDDVEPLTDFLLKRLDGGDGLSVLRRIERSKYRPSKKLMEHVSNVIKGQPEYVLLDEQKVVYEKVLACAEAGFQDYKKTALIVRGGPGTGKSVIAINLMSDLLHKGLNAHYATGSKAFTETLRRIIGKRGEVQFKYFNSYTQAEPNEIDVLICDEAHRIRETSNNRYTKADRRSKSPQIEELLQVSKVSVFFVDDNQVVRPNEIGSADYIRDHAQRLGCEIADYELEAQFRCAGSQGFVNWVNNTLGIQKTANIIWDQDEEDFDFRIMESPETLEAAIRAKADHGHSARVTAGFCWPWAKKPHPDGTLVEDVVIDDYHRPWNARGSMSRLAAGIPKEVHWAHDPNGINQIGCIYTAQGFEFDYVGVIFGPDLTYNFDEQTWRGNKDQSFDSTVKRSGDQFAELVKNTYRVLLSRGMKGCYVYFMDKDTERFFKSRMEGSPREQVDEAAIPRLAEDRFFGLPLPLLSSTEVQPFENAVPVYDLRVAAGRFNDEQNIDEVTGNNITNPEDYDWVALPDTFRLQPGLFVTQVVGESMNRRIPNGAWCLFKLEPAGTRQGKVVLVQHRDIQDPDTGGQFTIKVYESHKVYYDDGTWQHEQVVLRPDTTSSGYKPIELVGDALGELKVIAELVAVLG